MQQSESQKRRFDACVARMPRVLNANMVPGYIDRAQATISPLVQRTGLVAGSHADYTYRGFAVNKDRHLKRDEIKDYVEKALRLHDARGGMAVVSSPIWAPSGSLAAKGK
jgi:hypothetical protein